MIHYVYIMILKEWNITIITEFYLIWYLFHAEDGLAVNLVSYVSCIYSHLTR
jgi:hypothetical protein